MKSIIQNEIECFVCHTTTNLHCHHIYFGNGRRSISEKNGFKVYLCYNHHEGTEGVHGKNGHFLDELLKTVCQKKYEETHSREDFRTLIGKSYLGGNDDNTRNKARSL